ncbi:hypothetical protein BGW37DRAFT_529410 [Umbelopsis sp. PMI_123]|nr:hypothetical protein BGW37DRAFT_529410 [Umbelopsis sp. PMI_123]
MSTLVRPTSWHQIFTYWTQVIPNDTWFYYPEPVNGAHYRELTYKGTDDLLNHLAAQYTDILPKADESTVSRTAPKSIPNPPMVVATLGSNNIQLLLTGLAVQRMQHAYIHISPLNSDAGIVTLLESLDAKVLIADSVFYDRAAGLAAQIKGLQLVRLIDFDPVDELKNDLKTFNYDTTKNEGDNCTFIIHTSGTSGSAPKPIWRHNIGLLHPMTTPARSTTLTTGLMYHGLGGAACLLIANFGGSVAIPLSKDPNYRTLEQVMDGIKVLPNLKRIITHPILAQAIFDKYCQNDSPELEYLRKLDSWEVGGSKLSDEVANGLLHLGINVRSMIGSSEVGAYPFKNEPTKDHWDTLVVTKENQVSWEHIEGNQYELLLHDMPSLALNLGVPSGGVFHTNDVFEEASPKSGKWIYIGRRDQMLIHSMGLNTNPIPWENDIRNLEIVEECQLVGHNRRGPLLLVELDWSKVTDENKARETIWNAIEEHNNTVMAWSRVQHPAALVILPRGSHLERSDKQAVRRGVNIKKFEKEINHGYDTWDKAAPLAKA